MQQAQLLQQQALRMQHSPYSDASPLYANRSPQSNQDYLSDTGSDFAAYGGLDPSYLRWPSGRHGEFPKRKLSIQYLSKVDHFEQSWYTRRFRLRF